MSLKTKQTPPKVNSNKGDILLFFVPNQFLGRHTDIQFFDNIPAGCQVFQIDVTFLGLVYPDDQVVMIVPHGTALTAQLPR